MVTDEKKIEMLTEGAATIIDHAALLLPKINKASSIIKDIISNGEGKILSCGNGGSAANAQHFVGELIGRFLIDRAPMPAICLCSNASVLTSIVHADGSESLLSRQIIALGTQHDALVVFTTSIDFPNISHAISVAKGKGMKIVIFSGSQDTNKDIGDVVFSIPNISDTASQEIHMSLFHCICRVVEGELFGTW